MRRSNPQVLNITDQHDQSSGTVKLFAITFETVRAVPPLDWLCLRGAQRARLPELRPAPARRSRVQNRIAPGPAAHAVASGEGVVVAGWIWLVASSRNSRRSAPEPPDAVADGLTFVRVFDGEEDLLVSPTEGEGRFARQCLANWAGSNFPDAVWAILGTG